MKLAVGYPWSVEFCYTRCMDSLLNLKHPDGAEVRFFRGRGWCSARRHNHICEQALEWGADLLCILGTDQVYPDEDMLVKMVGRYRAGCGAVAALVPMRGLIARQDSKPFQLVGWRLKPESDVPGKNFTKLDHRDFEEVTREKHGDLVQVHAIGTGVLMFPTKVLTRIAPPWFMEKPQYPTFERDQCCDLPFVIRLQSEGETDIWVDTTIPVHHLNVFEVDETYSERFKDWFDGGGDPNICVYGPTGQRKVETATL